LSNSGIVLGETKHEEKTPSSTRNTQQPTIKKRKMDPVNIQNLMEVRTANERTISFLYVGNPPAQQRARLGWGRRRWFYDPDAGSKALFRAAMRDAMAEIDLALLPFAGVQKGLHIHCEFVLPRPRNDYERHGLVYELRENCTLYPGRKDVDNMLKYFMDALALVFYIDDNCIIDARATKAYPANTRYGTQGWAQVSVSSFH
jgi:Holliday junction resolvase RusA-like endonuclease